MFIKRNLTMGTSREEIMRVCENHTVKYNDQRKE